MIKINFAKQRKDTKRAIIVAVSIPSLQSKIKSATMIKINFAVNFAVCIPSLLLTLRSKVKKEGIQKKKGYEKS